MKVFIRLSDDESKKEYLVDINNKDYIVYFDELNGKNEIYVYDDGLYVLRTSDDHKTLLNLRSNPYAKIISEQGEFNFNVKVVANKKINDILILDYEIEGLKKEIEIKYLGD